jgi:hypothetical protein
MPSPHRGLRALAIASALALASPAVRAQASAAEQEEIVASLRAAHARAAAGTLDADAVAAWEELWRSADPALTEAPAAVSAAQIAAEVCEAGPPEAVRGLRAAVVRRLVAVAERSRRARRLLTSGLLPRLDRVPAAEQRAEVTAFDALLAECAPAPVPVAVDLAYARERLRVETHRAFDAPWLDAEERARSVAGLRAIARAHGDVESPGGERYATLAAAAADDLERLAFGAVLDLRGTDLEGKEHSSEEWHGRTLLLVFWTSWCRPCLAMVPRERALLETLPADRFALVGVCGDDDATAARATAARTGMTWPSLHDPLAAGGLISKRLHVASWPSAYVLDAEGRIRAKLLHGELRPNHDPDDLERAVRDVLSAASR